MSGGVLDRIAASQRGHASESLEGAILAHLSVLLNTRRGYCPLDSEYGIPDFTDASHHLPERLPRMQRMIVDAIERYEPRLQSVSVRALETPRHVLTVRFEVRARLRAGKAICFETQVTRGGQVRVF